MNDTTRKRLEEDRLKRLYQYLLSNTDLGTEEQSPARKSYGRKTESSSGYEEESLQPNKSKKPNESLIASQWGCDRIFVRRVLRFVYPELYSAETEDKKEYTPSIDMCKLVICLESLSKYHDGDNLKYQPYLKNNGTISKSRFTISHKLRALRLYSDLSSNEMECLGLEISIKSKLISQLLEYLQDPQSDISEELIREIYKTAIGQDKSLRAQKKDLDIEEYIDSLITAIFKERKNLIVNKKYLSTEDQEYKQYIRRYRDKVMRELERINFQNGGQQEQDILGNNTPKPNIDLVHNLTKCVVNNEILCDEFPIFIKHIEYTRVRPLPLRTYDLQNKNSDGLLDLNLVEDDEKLGIQALSHQRAYKVRVHFRARFEEKNNDYDFYEEARGIGSPISLVTSILNKVLLWDIPCLHKKKIFPVAKQVFIKSDILGNDFNSSVTVHTVVELCQQDIIEKAAKLDHDVSYDCLDLFRDGVGKADYCSFSTLEATAKSGLNARLDAIKNLGINPLTYLKELKKRIEQQSAFRTAESCLYSYPFSVWAMKGYLEQENLILNGLENADKAWSLVNCNAYLIMADALLVEGKQEAARKIYLDKIRSLLDQRKIYLDDLMLATYYYLMAYYDYLCDLKNRSVAIDSAENNLLESEKYLKVWVKKCKVIDILSQTNIHPFFKILGKIHFLKSRIYLGFNIHAKKRGSPSESLKWVLVNLQSARICAARDGSPNDYAYYSGFQSWLYSMIAFLSKEDFLNDLKLDRESCLRWSDQLRNHANICYSETGLNCYNEIKLNAGMIDHINDDHLYGNVRFESIQFIQEYQYDSTSTLNESIILNIPWATTLVENYQNNNGEARFFGTQACLLLFAAGMHHLTAINSIQIEEENVYKRESTTPLNNALRSLIAAYSIAQDGGRAIKKDSGEWEINRKFTCLDNFDKFGVSKIRGLYLHRVGYVVALSSIAIILTGILSLLQNYHEYLKYAKRFKSRNDLRRNKEYQQWINLKKSSLCLFVDPNDESNDRLVFTLDNDSEATDIYERKSAQESGIILSDDISQKCFNGYMEDTLKEVIPYFELVVQQIKNQEWDKDGFCFHDKDKAYCHWRDILMSNLLLLIIAKEPKSSP